MNTQTTTKRRTTEVAECAKAIRQVLKAQFPNIKFSVKSENYSGGDSVRVKYEDGPITEDVKN